MVVVGKVKNMFLEGIVGVIDKYYVRVYGFFVVVDEEWYFSGEIWVYL